MTSMARRSDAAQAGRGRATGSRYRSPAGVRRAPPAPGHRARPTLRPRWTLDAPRAAPPLGGAVRTDIDPSSMSTTPTMRGVLTSSHGDDRTADPVAAASGARASTRRDHVAGSRPRLRLNGLSAHWASDSAARSSSTTSCGSGSVRSPPAGPPAPGAAGDDRSRLPVQQVGDGIDGQVLVEAEDEHGPLGRRGGDGVPHVVGRRCRRQRRRRRPPQQEGLGHLAAAEGAPGPVRRRSAGRPWARPAGPTARRRRRGAR